MTTKVTSGSLFTIVLSLILISISGCNLSRSSKYTSQRDLNFNNGWFFHLGDPPGAQLTGFDDTNWREVDLPHDWGIEDLPDQDSIHLGPFQKDLEGGKDVGYLGGGYGWYRKVFTLEKEDEGNLVFLHFDGVQSEMQIWVNGYEVGEHVYGYTPFYFDLTPHLLQAGQPNQVAIKVFNPETSSRWYTGAGIYRDVKLSVVNPLYIDIWGVSVSTTHLSDSKAIVQLKVNLCNKYQKEMECVLLTEIISPSGLLISNEEQVVSTDPGTKKTVTAQLEIEDPKTWDPDFPTLHTARISVKVKGKIIDEFSSPFGIRTIAYSATDGFLLNGKEVLLKGACLHHDNGLLGAAAFSKAEERRVRIMKENGYNAIRTSHNPPSTAFLDACDRLGMLVIDESFDMWVLAKRPNDYHLQFDEWWQKDLESMLLRDRNHPSIIMWSFGNEVQERALPSGLAIAGEMISFIKSIDATIPVTQAICGFWDNPGLEWDHTAPAFEMLDISGYNYQWQNYLPDHEKYPARVMYGSESFPKEAYENWQLVKTQPYVIGDFVWTGMDYIGESGIGHGDYFADTDKSTSFLRPWPWYVSWCGDIDITGNKKPQSYYRDVLWDQSNLELLVHEPVSDGMYEATSQWGWPQEYKSWTWPGHEGEPLHINVYSTYPEVRLELNGQLIGQKSIPASARNTAFFTVPFTAGELKAIGIRDGENQESQSLKSTGPIAGLKLIPEDTILEADRNEIVYIRVVGTDSEDEKVPNSEIPLHIEIAGEGELLAAGNASPLIQGSLQDNEFNLFRGEALVIIRSTGKAGFINLEVSSGQPKAIAQTTISVH